MIVLLINILLLAIVEIGLWFAGTLLKFELKLVIAAMVAIALVWIIAYLLLLMLAIRRSSTIATSLHTAPSATGSGVGPSPQQIAAMQEQFDRYLQALRASPGGKSALAALPWYLVIGAPGSGKTTALQESGLAFSSMGHGLRSVRGIGGTRNCDWWFTDQAILLDTAGRYTTQPEDQGEWFAFLDLIRHTRKGHPLNGIVVMVSIAELLKSHEAAIPALVRPIRERIAEVSTRLKVVLPVYVVFSKADLIGGFKDFFSNMSRGERDQVWGATLSPADLAGHMPADAFREQMNHLYARVQSYRLHSLALDRPFAQRAKICVFPQNFLVAEKWLGEFITELFRPTPVPDQPVFRGFYLTSGIQNSKLGDVQKTVMPAAPAPATREFARPGTEEMSIFFDSESAQLQNNAPLDLRNGFFLKDLFTRVIIPDHSLAGLPSRLVRRTHWLRMSVACISVLVAILAVAVLISDYLANRRLIEPARDAVREVLHAQKLDDKLPGTAKEQLVALDHLRKALLAIRNEGRGSTGRELADQLDSVYCAVLKPLFIMPSSSLIIRRMEALRDQKGKNSLLFGELFDLLRAYKSLTDTPAHTKPSLPAAEQQCLTKVLTDQPIWVSHFLTSANQVPPSDIAKLAGDQLNYFLVAMPSMKGWAIPYDPTLAKSVEEAMTNVTWVMQGYTDMIEGMQSVGDVVGKEVLSTGTNSDLLVSDYTFSTVFTKDKVPKVYSAIDETAAILVNHLKGLSVDKSVEQVTRELHDDYAQEYKSHWLHLLGDLRPKPFASLSDAERGLKILSGSDSPYVNVLRQLAAVAKVNSDDLNVDNKLTQGKWLQDGLNATSRFQSALSDYITDTRVNERITNIPKLKGLCDAAAEAAKAYDTAIQDIPSGIDHDYAKKCLGQILSAVGSALNAELAREADALWSNTFYNPYMKDCSGHFPFDMESQTDADLGTFDRLFNPKDGALGAINDKLQLLRNLHFPDMEVLPFTPLYEPLVGKQLQLLQEGLFNNKDKDAKKVSLGFTVIIQKHRGNVDEITLSIGADNFSNYKTPDSKKSFEWSEEDPAGAKVSISESNSSRRKSTPDHADRAWGILRLFHEGKPVSQPQGGSMCTWNLNDISQVYTVQVLLLSPPLEAMCGGDFFRNFKVPSRVSR